MAHLYESPSFKPEPSASLYSDSINNGLIGLFRPDVLYENIVERTRPWSYFEDIEPPPRIISDPDGQWGLVWTFDGENDTWVTIPDGTPTQTDPAIYQPDKLTVAGWGRFRPTLTEPRGSFVQNTQNFNSVGWGMYINEDGPVWKFRSWTEGWSTGAAESAQDVIFDRWYHWAFTHDGLIGDLTQYINGFQDGFLPNLERQLPRTGNNALNIGNAQLFGNRQLVGEVAEVRIWNRVLEPAEIWALWDAPTRHRIWYIPNSWFTPPEGPLIFNLDVDGLSHDHPIDQVAISVESQDLDVQDSVHVRPVDAPVIEPSYDIFAATLTHVRPVDELLLEVTTDLFVEDLTHEAPLDQVDLLATTAALLTIEELDHARALDALLLEPTHNLLVDGLDHARFLEQTDVQVLLGDATELRATAADWRMDAGQTLITTAGADQNWHVIDCVFDGVNSEIRVDNGPAVVGDAGVRALELLSLGADVDGENRAIGYVAEFRIYNNNIPLAFRQSIADFLIKKWIQP